MQVKHRYHAVLNIFFFISLKKAFLFPARKHSIASDAENTTFANVEVVMVPFNIMRRQYGENPALGLFQLARRMDIWMVIMKPIASGRIGSNKTNG